MKSDARDIEVNETKTYKSNDMMDNLDFQQVELSHGSSLNQPSMYQTSQSSSDYTTKSFCCDLLFVIFLFTSTVLLVLFWIHRIPSLDEYFNKRHPHSKVIVFGVACAVVIVVFIIFVIRCAKRTCCPDIFNFKRFRSKINSDSLDSKDGKFSTDDISGSVISNPKLSELEECDLHELKRILGNFIEQHDDSDWFFSPCSVPVLSRRGGYNSENNMYKQVEENVKIRTSIKVILVGQPNVGKTSVFHRILYDRFSEYYMATLGADLAHVSLHLYPWKQDDHVMVSLQLWDIAGSERFSELSHIVYKDATAFIVICDVTHSNYVTQAVPWVDDIMQLKYEPHVTLFLNKIDLLGEQKDLTFDTLTEHDLLTNLDKFSVSAKTGECVLENVIHVLTKSILHEVGKLL